jgi:hypothetical protein
LAFAVCPGLAWATYPPTYHPPVYAGQKTVVVAVPVAPDYYYSVGEDPEATADRVARRVMEMFEKKYAVNEPPAPPTDTPLTREDFRVVGGKAGGDLDRQVFALMNTSCVQCHKPGGVSRATSSCSRPTGSCSGPGPGPGGGEAGANRGVGRPRRGGGNAQEPAPPEAGPSRPPEGVAGQGAMKYILAGIAAVCLAGAVEAGCPHYGGYGYGQVTPYQPSLYYVPPVNEVEIVIAHPVYNRVDVVQVVQKQVYIPAVVSGQTIVQREVVVKDNVIVADQVKTVVKITRKY